MLSQYPKIRVTLYVAAVVAQVVAFFARIYSPELGGAFSDTANFLGTLAGVTALTNLSDPRSNGLGGKVPEID